MDLMLTIKIEILKNLFVSVPLWLFFNIKKINLSKNYNLSPLKTSEGRFLVRPYTICDFPPVLVTFS